MGKHHKKKMVTGADGWQTRQPKQPKQQDLAGALATALQAVGIGVPTRNPKGNGPSGGGSHGDGKQFNGIKPRQAQDGDPPAGVLRYETGGKWCALTYEKRLYRFNVGSGGWQCSNCAMPANRDSRWYCAVCGKKWTKDCANMAPNKPDESEATEDSGEEESSEDMDSDGDDDAVVAKKCVAETRIPNYTTLKAALKTPSPLVHTETLETPAGASDAVAAAQAKVDKAAGLLQFAQADTDTPKDLLDRMSTNLEAKKKVLSDAKAKALKSGEAPAATPATALLRLEEAQSKLLDIDTNRTNWRAAATKRQDGSAEEALKVVAEFRRLSAALALEAEKYAEDVRVNQEAWEAVNVTVQAKWDAKHAAQTTIVKQLSTAAPVAIPAAVAVVTPPVVIPFAPPTLKPLVELPAITLPESQDDIRTMAVVLTGLHLLEEQDLEVRSAFPVCWGTLAEYGLLRDMMLTLLPAELIGKHTADNVVVPQRTIGALRRQLDRMAALWETKSAELSASPAVQERALAMYADIIDETKQAKRRRTPPSS